MSRKFVHISHILGAHDLHFLEAAQRSFDEVHLITFRLGELPEWLKTLPKVKVHNLEKKGRPYDDPDESRYSSVLERVWIGWNLSRYSREVSTLVKKIQPKIVQGMWVPTDGFLAAKIGFHPLVIAPFVTDVVKKPLISLRLKKKIGETLQLADRIVVDCHWVREQIQIFYPQISTLKFCVFPRGVDLNVFYPASPSVEEKKTPVIICNRLFEDVYDHETLFRALDLIPPETLFELRLAGEGSLGEKIKNRVQSSKWKTKVTFLGKLTLSEMALQLRESSIYVSCSKQDGTSVSLLEAMASGLPTVVSDLPVNREWVENKKTGYLFSPGSAEKLAESLENLFHHQGHRRSLGTTALAVAREKADWSKHQQTLLGLYRNLV